jgi:alkylation response protein AidB-like acyl-CoA dehydrogenase
LAIDRKSVNRAAPIDNENILAVADRLAAECLTPRAAHYDATATHPVESWRDVWEEGMLAMGIPRRHGGLELDMPTYIRVIERLAEGCTNTGMTVHMHSTVTRFIDALATEEQRAFYFREIVEDGKLFGSWGSEPETRGGTALRLTTIVPQYGGYVINGVKHFCTMSGGAHRYMIHCSSGDDDPVESQWLALLPHDSSGIEQIGDWDTLGMRATVSPAMRLNNCFVGPDAPLGRPGEAPRTGVTQGFGLGFAAVYLGAAQAALDFTQEFARTQTFAPDPSPIAEGVVVQRAVAEMSMALEGARRVLHAGASVWHDAKPAERAVLSARAKYLATVASLDITSKAIQIAGGRSAHKRMPLERLYRDVRTSTLMPPNLDRCLELVGRFELGLDTPLYRDA